jgi:hypothetical protein
MRRALSRLGGFGALALLYVVLFGLGTTLFPVSSGPAADPADASRALLGLVGCAAIDTVGATLALVQSRPGSVLAHTAGSRARADGRHQRIPRRHSGPASRVSGPAMG